VEDWEEFFRVLHKIQPDFLYDEENDISAVFTLIIHTLCHQPIDFNERSPFTRTFEEGEHWPIIDDALPEHYYRVMLKYQDCDLAALTHLQKSFEKRCRDCNTVERKFEYPCVVTLTLDATFEEMLQKAFGRVRAPTSHGLVCLVEVDHRRIH